MISIGRVAAMLLLSASVQASHLPPGCGEYGHIPKEPRDVATDPPNPSIGGDHPDRYGTYQVRAYSPYYGEWFVQPTWMVYNHDQGFWTWWHELENRKDGNMWDYPSIWKPEEEVE
jgi:hypothetical protein